MSWFGIINILIKLDRALDRNLEKDILDIYKAHWPVQLFTSFLTLDQHNRILKTLLGIWVIYNRKIITNGLRAAIAPPSVRHQSSRNSFQITIYPSRNLHRRAANRRRHGQSHLARLAYQQALFSVEVSLSPETTLRNHKVSQDQYQGILEVEALSLVVLNFKLTSIRDSPGRCSGCPPGRCTRCDRSWSPS